MKPYLLAIICSMAFLSASSQEKGYTIIVDINNPKAYPLTLLYSLPDKMVLDTNAAIKNGKYIFTGQVGSPTNAKLLVRNAFDLGVETPEGTVQPPSLSFFLTNDTIKIKGSADKIYLSSIQGSVLNKQWAPIHDAEQKWDDKVWLLTKATYQKNNAGSPDETKLLIASSDRSDQFKKLYAGFIKQYPSSTASAYCLSNLLEKYEGAALQEAYSKLGAEAKQSLYGQFVKMKIDSYTASLPGKPAIAINKRDRLGNIINLDSLKGKYVLLDFWGSWCGPCRKSHPHLKELYSKYHDKGFEIISISKEQELDLADAKLKWMQAIQQDGLTWPQVLNNEDAETSSAVKDYSITEYPTEILIDKDGKIVGRYIGIGPESEELEAVLNKIFQQ